MLREEEIKKYLKAGEVVYHTLNIALNIIEEGQSLLKIAERLEREISDRNAKPAFPVNISINHVAAHYSPSINDLNIIPRKSVIKVDVGAHIDGYIADAAITISFNPKYEKLLMASRSALENVEKNIRPGISLGSIGELVEKTILQYGYKPISNLSGHKIDRYNLHAGKSVPNISTYTFKKIEKNEVYAIEPFATDGAGYVVEMGNGHIYQLTLMKKIKEDRELQFFMRKIWMDYHSLPFSERWIYKRYGEEGFNKLLDLITYKRVYVYHSLVDKYGGIVSQFEDTIIITRQGPIITTKVLEL